MIFKEDCWTKREIIEKNSQKVLRKPYANCLVATARNSLFFLIFLIGTLLLKYCLIYYIFRDDGRKMYRICALQLKNVKTWNSLIKRGKFHKTPSFTLGGGL